MISIVTGTLDRKDLLPGLIDNTVNKSEKLELVLVDGGSTDGTIEYIKELQHPQIKLIEYGKRSPYPHFMNLGIESSKYEYIVQWNDDVLLVNDWDDIFNEIDDSEFYIFNWKYGNSDDITNLQWVKGDYRDNGWCIWDDYEKNKEVVMNYGIYSKKIFREIGLYSNEYKYYYADGDMARRAYLFGYKMKSCPNIKVCSINTQKKAIQSPESVTIYERCHEEYKNKFLNNNIEFLK